MLIFVVSDDMSHTVSPRPGKHEEQPVGSRAQKIQKKTPPLTPVALLCLSFSLLSSIPSFHFLSDAAHVPASDSDLHDVIGLCLPAAL